MSIGAMLFSIGLNAIVIPHGFITGGISGVGLLIYYITHMLSPGMWYLLINIPLFLFGWIFVSRRFFFYSLYGMLIVSVAMDLVAFQIPIKDPFLAIMAGGVFLGAGGGITLHSLGSLGGMDIVCVIMNKKFGIRIGSFLFAFNALLFGSSLGALDTDLVLYSVALSYVSSQVLDYVLTIFNQRKMIVIISDWADDIADIIQKRMNRGATFLNGTGAYTGREKKVFLTVVHNYQIKMLEEAVMAIDPEAFVITENTFNVIGKGFSRPKVY
jgi:uncharacterized membrane-anchored protein YitT (DUF2179 family)